ncbi:MAG: dephospho-CoA kinase [Bacteroidales bacterium]|nr:dephospho-CoA kinase [Bacteroidales bacterium]
MNVLKENRLEDKKDENTEYNIRINRIIKRDGVKEQDVINRMNNQINDKKRIKKSDFVITNDKKELIIPQVLYIEKQILKNCV